MLHLAKSENVRSVVEETVDIVLQGGADEKNLEKHKKKITETMETFFQLSIEAIANYDEDKCKENCGECDLLMLCLRLIEGVEAWKEDPSSISIIGDVMNASGEEERDMLRCLSLEFE